MKKILLIATGGTIASADSSQGLTPTLNGERLLSHIPEAKELCFVESISLMSIDSTNMNPALIANIAETIHRFYQSYDGFVITHGTDTMAYTSAALVYMLQNIQKPIIFTGAQIPIEMPYTDAKQNLTDAIRIAIENIQGVFIVFGGYMINGARAMKVKTRSLDAFASINFPYVANIKFGKISYNKELPAKFSQQIFKKNLNPFVLNTKYNDSVSLLKITPAIKPQFFNCIKENCKGLIIESFGIGGIPNQNPDIVSKIKELIELEIAVVISTQCLYESIDLSVYEVGQVLSKHYIIDGGDMTSEALLMKLMWAMGNFNTIKEIKAFIEATIFGDRN